LAKYYEHRKINIGKAIEYTNRARNFLNVIEEINIQEKIGEIRGSFDHRYNRLSNKLRKRKFNSA